MSAAQRRNLMGIALMGGMCAFGCSPDTLDGIGPRVPIQASPNVTGRVVREGLAVPNHKVGLRDPDDHTTLSEDRTDPSGRFELRAPVGTSEIEVNGLLAGDFASVTLALTVPGDTSLIDLATPIDLSAYGARLENPPDGARAPPPTPTATIEFHWQMPNRTPSSARLQIYDADGQPVWISAAVLEPSLTWNGVGNQGTYVGRLAPAGDYEWRVKFDLPDGSEARLARRSLAFE